VREDERFPREELRARLAEKGIPEWPFLWPLEKAFGGVEVRIGWSSLHFAITYNLAYYRREELTDEGGRVRFVPLGEWESYSAMLGEDGGIYFVATPDRIERMAPSFEGFLEHQAMLTSFRAWAPKGCAALLSPGSVAPMLANEYSIPPVREASSELHKWWQDDCWTLYATVPERSGMIWARALPDLARAMEAATRITPILEVHPQPSYEDEHVEVLTKDEIAARAPTPESLRARHGARRFDLLGEPSIYKSKPPSTGDVWVSGEGDDMRIDVLERREGEVVNYWQITHEGSHALLSSRYGRG
jgi:hypothetical protein